MSLQSSRPPRPERNRIETVVTVAAASTIFYYVVAFCFEVGFFWEIGLGYLSASGIGEHLAHAGASFLVSVLFILSMLFLLGMQAVIRHYVEVLLGVVPQEPAPSAPKAPLTPLRKLVVALLVAPAFVMLAAYLFGTLIPMLAEEFTAGAMLGVLAVICAAAYLLESLLGSRTRWWLGPAVLCGMFAPTAFGELEYNRLLAEPASSSFKLKGTDRIAQGTMIFAGTSKFIMMKDGRCCLVDYDLKTVLMLGSKGADASRLSLRDCGIDVAAFDGGD